MSGWQESGHRGYWLWLWGDGLAPRILVVKNRKKNKVEFFLFI